MNMLVNATPQQTMNSREIAAVAPRFYDTSAQDIIYIHVEKDEVTIQ